MGATHPSQSTEPESFLNNNRHHLIRLQPGPSSEKRLKSRLILAIIFVFNFIQVPVI